MADKWGEAKIPFNARYKGALQVISQMEKKFALVVGKIGKLQKFCLGGGHLHFYPNCRHISHYSPYRLLLYCDNIKDCSIDISVYLTKVTKSVIQVCDKEIYPFGPERSLGAYQQHRGKGSGSL